MQITEALDKFTIQSASKAISSIAQGTAGRCVRLSRSDFFVHVPCTFQEVGGRPASRHIRLQYRATTAKPIYEHFQKPLVAFQVSGRQAFASQDLDHPRLPL